MNIQDVAEFLDLVKNPEKYEALLERLVSEQARLKAVIETVGEVSEINQIKADMLKAEEDANEAYNIRLANLKAQQEQASLIHKTNMDVLTKDQQHYTAMLEEQKALLAETKAANKHIKQVEKDVIAKELEVSNRLDAVILLQQEYDEKVAKLRSVMV